MSSSNTNRSTDSNSNVELTELELTRQKQQPVSNPFTDAAGIRQRIPSKVEEPKLSNEVVDGQKKRKVQSDIQRDLIIGFADGMTVPFALTAGITTVTDRKTIIIAGLLELIGAAVSMGSSAFLAAIQERDQFIAEEAREEKRLLTEPDEACHEIAEIMRDFEIDRPTLEPVLVSLAKQPDAFLRFLMKFKYEQQKRSLGGAFISAAVMGFAYFFAGLLPMIPYFAMPNVTHALYVSIAIAFVEFSILGYRNGYQTYGTTLAGLRVAVMTLAVGATAAGATFGCGKLLNVIVH
jgi:VIT1/CCC1 family predicted Fe2+/Mn2+ transporter